jgi:hypothetical protein
MADSFDLGEPPQPAGKATPYRVLARKYRPQTFRELIGQDAMVTTLGNAIRRDLRCLRAVPRDRRGAAYRRDRDGRREPHRRR